MTRHGLPAAAAAAAATGTGILSLYYHWTNYRVLPVNLSVTDRRRVSESAACHGRLEHSDTQAATVVTDTGMRRQLASDVTTRWLSTVALPWQAARQVRARGFNLVRSDRHGHAGRDGRRVRPPAAVQRPGCRAGPWQSHRLTRTSQCRQSRDH